MSAIQNPAEQVSLPDRFEILRRRAEKDLTSIVVSVDEALASIDQIVADMAVSGRGAFLVLRGNSGAGKTTFLHTVCLFRQGVKSTSVPAVEDPRRYFSELRATNSLLEIFILEEREVEVEFSDSELETLLHAINSFIRSSRGPNALVVWPCNTDQLRDRIVGLSEKLGADSLLGTGEPSVTFSGPAKHQYRHIAERTVSILNEGATFSDLGLSEEQVVAAIDASNTIGSFLGRIRRNILENKRFVRKLLIKEHPKLWVIVLSGDEPDKDVAALTRGQHASIDIERLLSATDANIVKELKRQPDKLGVLASVLDAKIFHMPVLTALYICRTFADDALKAKMRAKDLSLSPASDIESLRRLSVTDFANILSEGTQGLLARGAKIGNNTEIAFKKLADIASTNDSMLNKSFGEILVYGNYIKSYKTEQEFGQSLTFRTDIVCQSDGGPIRLEMMWRAKTSRAEIANYVLGKLQNYGKAIGLLT